MVYYADLDFYENISEWVMDYNGLADPFTVKQQIGISNTYTAELWFRAELVAPGANYANFSVDLGSILAGLTDYKAFTFDRVLPGAKVTDNLTLRLTAYTDAYITELCHDDLAVSFYLFDHADVGLGLVDHDTFDTEGDFESWTAVGSRVGLKQDPTYFINAPYSLSAKATAACSAAIPCYINSYQKTFTVGAASEAFLVYHFYKTSNPTSMPVEIDDVSYIPTTVLAEYDNGKWYRVALKIPTGADVKVNIGCYAEAAAGQPDPINNLMIDDVWVVTSP